ncbi:progonadoliberin-1-like [Carcharodon carcharias]|uniref:progonadoliberin-1-like n=1 Tax=Carcharodon carcharias TaxID=13397 RepID=UPI001B7E58AB|nr:progonadoliberin-1-like [Carcharodon carcharias]
MTTVMKSLVYIALGCAIFVNFLSAQHWSFDLRPGGKREAGDDVIESFRDTAVDVDELTHDKRTEFAFPDCFGSTLAKFTPRRKKL